MACLSAQGPGTTFIACARCITGRIISAACGIRIAFMIATGSLCAVRGSMISMTMIEDSESSTGVISIVDASSVKRGNFMGTILIVSVGSIMEVILIADAGSERIGAAILTVARRIEAGDIKVTEVVDVEEGKSKVG